MMLHKRHRNGQAISKLQIFDYKNLLIIYAIRCWSSF